MENNKTYAAVVVASGKGARLNLGFNKVFYRLKDGKTILDHALSSFLLDEDCRKIVVVTNRDDFDLVLKDPKIKLVEGGKMRADSVYNGLKEVDEAYVFVHDGARPYLDTASLNALKEKVFVHDAAILAVKAKDTIKYVKDGFIERTLDRNYIYLAQTPQAFKTSLLKACYQKAKEMNMEFTDEAMVVEQLGYKIAIAEGSYDNNKITFKEDLKGEL